MEQLTSNTRAWSSTPKSTSKREFGQLHTEPFQLQPLQSLPRSAPAFTLHPSGPGFLSLLCHAQTASVVLKPSPSPTMCGEQDFHKCVSPHQTSRRSCGCSNPGDVQGQAGWDFEGRQCTPRAPTQRGCLRGTRRGMD